MTATRGADGWLLQTERLFLQRVTPADAALMLAVWNDPAFMHFVGDRGIRTEEQALAAMQAGAFRLYREFGYGPYALSLKEDGRQVGICGLFRREHLEHPDIGFALLPEFCGRGYAYEASVAVLAHARDDLGITTLTAIVSPQNAASIALIEKLGLRFDRSITMPGDTEAISLYSIDLS